jgi:cathepsin F/cysteine peptidase B
LIEKQNSMAKGVTTFGINKFTDLCPEEFKKMYASGLTGVERNITTVAQVSGTASCTSINWLTKGAVTPVGNQGQCGACWAWSTIANCEGVWATAGNKLVALSVEELLDCSTQNYGCNGGELPASYQWIIQNGGLDSAADYPYTAGGGTVPACQTNKLKHIVASFSSFVNLAQNEKDIAAYVCEHGPVNAVVDALSWQTYSGGILTVCQGASPDHTIAIVGFDLTASVPYWILKNSWGVSWGENGYIRIEYGKNLCGIRDQASSAVPGK